MPKEKAVSGRAAQESRYLNPVAEYLPIYKIENGIIYTKDYRYVKIVEVNPINFMLRSSREQRSIIYSFIGFLKISPVKVHFKVLTKCADINRHVEMIRQEMETETDENCRMLQEDYLDLIKRLGSKEATTRRFLLAFEYESEGARRGNEEAQAISFLHTAARTAQNFLKQCGNDLLIPENEDEFLAEVLYSVLCRQTSNLIPLQKRVPQVIAEYAAAGKDISDIPCSEFFAPKTLDFTRGRFVCVDGLYQSYLLIPSHGYKAEVPAGWLSLLVNAGDGIDVDLFLTKQPKDRMVQKLGQQLRINHSKIKDASDTNTNFDSLDDAIKSGYFLKRGIAENEDFYYMNTLITITANSPAELDYREKEMRKLLLSHDIGCVT